MASLISTAILISAATACAQPVAKDGDNLVCGETDVRVEGVNAAELRGKPCPLWRPCPAMGAAAARDVMAALIGDGLTYRVSYQDRHGRAVAEATLADGRDLACALIDAGAAVRWDRYWPEGKTCEQD